MVKTLALAAALLYHPAPVQSLGLVFNSSGSVTLQWTLPSDPSVVGVTIFRDNLHSGDTVEFVLSGSPTSFTDSALAPDDSYRYWVHTRDAQGDLSDGVYVEVWGDDHGHSDWWCVVTSVPGSPAPWIPLAAAVLLAAALFLRR
jgi:MYXO-CTERM domain-containing protein